MDQNKQLNDARDTLKTNLELLHLLSPVPGLTAGQSEHDVSSARRIATQMVGAALRDYVRIAGIYGLPIL